MARISEKNRKYISKADIVGSVSKVYQLYTLSELPNFHILLDHFLWAWKEYNGKYKGCKWWSEKAYEQYVKREENKTKGLIHDHVVPRDVIRQEILKMVTNNCTEEQLYNFFDRHLLGCVITKEEDNTFRKLGLRNILGCNLDTHTTWNRYEVAKISRKKVMWRK
ncbi:hypothetical protein SAMN05216232_3749 [Virgibacillus subterraneus]|uniref:Uncharacterized protein n=1 Tax=Virgibacillus subterraneus TaxID=621109 RepID=A0A1H9K5K5_9BACI|nr:hypothetical protein [Virgibacillus subterraneus]SEQ94399.1 hypothetical protein SAMN05216232_3749 [Virgibacillus subterraneus]